MDRHPPTGIGLGLRSDFLTEVVRGDADGRVAFFEVTPENYIHRGGRPMTSLAQIAERHPILAHGVSLSLGGVDPFDPVFLAALRGFLERHPGPWYSDHLCFCHHGAELHDLLPLPFTEEGVRRVAARIREVSDRLATPMLFENISYYLELGRGEMDEAAFIAAILDEAECGLLLDVNNIYVNAENHGFDPFAWLARIPLDKVRQLHIAGHEPWDETTLIDTHGATVKSEVYAMMAWVIERTGPLPVLLERDTNIPPLAELLDEVAAIDRTYQGALARWRRAQGPAEEVRP
ncbi:MAG: DUF692 domain-containing protein [Nannocystaceae bacterium]